MIHLQERSTSVESETRKPTNPRIPDDTLKDFAYPSVSVRYGLGVWGISDMCRFLDPSYLFSQIKERMLPKEETDPATFGSWQTPKERTCL